MNERIAVVGAGLIGRAWAIVFARAGCQVQLHDADSQALQDCQQLLLENLSDLAQDGLITEAPSTVLARIRAAPTLADAVQGAVLVQENIRETLEAKRAIVAEHDRMVAPDTIFANSPSWLMALVAHLRCQPG